MTKLDFIDRPLTVKDPPDFTVVSTFAGCGGSSTGYVWAGGKVLLAIEWDDNAVETYCLNYPDTSVYHGDIAKLSVEECLSLAGIKSGELDILDGSPPCQGFSTAGKRDFEDSRNQLFREYIRLLRGLRPKVFVMENVPGMVKGKMKLIFAEIMRELKASGYRVRCQKLNAMYFGVPQSRERMIFIGVREDLGIEPSFPKAWGKPICALCAVQDIQDTSNPYGHRNFEMGRRYLEHHRPSPTLTKSEVPGSDLPFIDDVRIADKRAAIIASYPQSFVFVGDWKDAINRIGNSVPPRFMQAIAEHIRDHILEPRRID